jgi:hypothetical protein
MLAIEELKLRFVTDNYGDDTWNRYALWALSSIYGIEFLEDNLKIARQNMLERFTDCYDAAHGALLSEQSNLYNQLELSYGQMSRKGTPLRARMTPARRLSLAVGNLSRVLQGG